MRKGILIVTLCVVSAFALVYAAYGQSQEYIDKLKESERHIALLKKVDDAIATIEKDRKPQSQLKFIDITDLMIRIPDYSPPSPFVYDVESGWVGGGGGGGISFDDEESEDWEGELFGPDELIELIKSRTDDENWPEGADGFGTIELHRNKLIVCNTPEVIKKVENILEVVRSNLPALISSTVYLFATDENYLKQVRKKGSSIITPEAIRKLIADAQAGGKVELLRTGYLAAYSSQAVYLYSGTMHTYQGDTDTSGAGGLTPIEMFDPIINIFREGFIVGLRAQYNRHTDHVNLVAMVSLSKLTAIEVHKGIGGGFAEDKEGGVTACKIETPKVDLQIVSGSSDVPEGYGLLLGGSRMQTTQAEQKSFVVLIVPAVQK